MKTENTPENKERFIALYWGQRVLLDVNNGGEPTLYPVDRSNMYRLDESILELTPLSKISHEDADELSKVGLSDRLYDYLWGYPTGKAIAKSIEGGRQTNVFYANFRMADAFDFLRSRGYYVGDGTEIEYGWVVLKGEKS